MLHPTGAHHGTGSARNAVQGHDAGAESHFRAQARGLHPDFRPGVSERHGRLRRREVPGFYIFSGNLGMKPSRLGIRTLGRVWAFMASFSPISLLAARRYAVNA